MAKRPNVMTPFLAVIASHCEKMDKPYKKNAEPMYKIRFEAPKGKDLKAWQDKLLGLAGNPKFSIPDPKIGIGESKKGEVTVVASSKFKPGMFDTKNNKLEAPKVGQGTIARAFCQLNVHDEGISLQLSQVQIKELKEWEGGSGAVSAFDEAEGYESEGGSQFNDDAPAESKGGSALDI